jgi:hypothetical protein
MIPRKLALGLAALVLISGCRSTSNRIAYCTQPAVVAAVPAPCATAVAPAPACPSPGAIPPPPPGFAR